MEIKPALQFRRGGLPLALALCLLCAVLSRSAIAESKISLSASVDKSTITIGDLITYTVKIVRDKDVTVKLPALGENLGGFEIRDYEVLSPRNQDGKIVEQVNYIISTFETGDFEIPPVAIRYTIPPDTTEKVLKTESIQIKVESVKPSKEGDIKDIKPPWELPVNWRRWLLIGAIVLAFALLILFAVYYWKKRRRGETILPKKMEPARPPHEVALEELEQLKASDLLSRGMVKAYFSELSDIIRRYIEGRYQIIALELTTTELLTQLERLTITDDIHTLFTRFLEQCDLVKFAKYIPPEPEIRDAFDMARTLVEKTAWYEERSPQMLPESDKEELQHDEQEVVDEINTGQGEASTDSQNTDKE